MAGLTPTEDTLDFWDEVFTIAKSNVPVDTLFSIDETGAEPVYQVLQVTPHTLTYANGTVTIYLLAIQRYHSDDAVIIALTPEDPGPGVSKPSPLPSYMAVIWEDVPVENPAAISSNFTPSTPAAPYALTNSFAPGSPSAPGAISSGFTPSTPTAPPAISQSWVPPGS